MTEHIDGDPTPAYGTPRNYSSGLPAAAYCAICDKRVPLNGQPVATVVEAHAVAHAAEAYRFVMAEVGGPHLTELPS